MSDRLPAPMNDVARADLRGGERASATPATHATHATSRRAKSAAGPRIDRVPTSLVDVQRWMVNAIIDPDVRPDGIESVLKGSPRLGVEERLDVYRTGYQARLIECVRDDYPVLADVVGDPCFDDLARAYIRAHPSTHPNLNSFSSRMPAFLRSADVAGVAPMRAFAVGLASLEWAMVEVLHAETAASFDLAALQAIPIDDWGGARLQASDAVRLLRFEHAVNPYYQACRVGERPSALPPPEASATVVYRRDLAIWRMDLTPAMADMLNALLTGVTIGDALEQLATSITDPEALAEAERSVMVWFREWVKGGLFSSIVLQVPTP